MIFMEDAAGAVMNNWIEKESAKLGIAGDHIKNNADLLEYINFLENELERLKAECQVKNVHYIEKKRDFKERLRESLVNDDETDKRLKPHIESKADVQTTIQQLKGEFEETENLLWHERKREKDLETKIQGLELELQRKNELINHCRKKDEASRKHLEEENHKLKKKTTLSWMLGYLTDVYLQLQPQGTTPALLKMVRRMQRELERENLILSYSKAPKLESDSMQAETGRLVDFPEGVQNQSRKIMLPNRSIEEEYIAELGRGENRQRCPNDWSRKAFTPRSSCEDKGCEEPSSPSANFVVDPSGSARNKSFNKDAIVTDSACLDVYPSPPPGHLQSGQRLIEMFDANQAYAGFNHHVKKPLDILSDWGEVKLAKEQNRGEVGTQICQNEIKKMLSSIELNLLYLLEQEKKRKLKDRQLEHSRYQTVQKVEKAIVGKKKHWNF